MPEAKGYIFDLDGTLVSLPVDWDGLRERLRSTAHATEEFRPVFQTLEKIISEKPELKGPLFRAIDEFELVAAPKATLLKGSTEVLDLLRPLNLSLVTMQGTKVKDYLFESLGLGKRFRVSFTRDDSLDRATQLELVLSQTRLPEKDVIFVGDRLNDLNAAKKVGLRFILIKGKVDEVDPRNSYPGMDFLVWALKSNERIKILNQLWLR